MDRSYVFLTLVFRQPIFAGTQHDAHRHEHKKRIYDG
jgi:hypothetical protein